MKFILLAFLVQIVLSATISNIEPRFDENGQIMDIHDGNLLKWNDTFYWFGMGYQNCTLEKGLLPPQNCPGIYHSFGRCGFRNDHQLNLYTSKDLENWKFVGDIFPKGQRPEGIYYRPKIVFNEKTSKFILWINYLAPAWSPLQAYPKAVYIVASSENPEGPFTVENEKANVAETGGGDFVIFVDPKDQKGYIGYDAWGNSHKVKVEQLTDDYLDSLGKNASSETISASSNEAPMMFELKGFYYLIYGHTCCFCDTGSGALTWWATHPLGPWTSFNTDINPMVDIKMDDNSLFKQRTIKAQNNFVFQVNDGEYIYTGDLWASAHDGLKSHDLQYWYPLYFDDSTTPPRIAPMTWKDQVEINIGESETFIQ